MERWWRMIVVAPDEHHTLGESPAGAAGTMIEFITQPLVSWVHAAWDVRRRSWLEHCARSSAVISCCAAWRFWATRCRTPFCRVSRLPDILKGDILIGGLVAAIVVALGIGFFTKHGTLKEDTAIGILFAATLSLGVALISTIKTYAVDLTDILFGNVLGVSEGDLILIAVLGLVVLLTIILLYKELLVVSFDPVLAATLHLPTGLLKNVLLILIALAVVVSMQTVGVGLVAAMLVTPAATAYLLTRRLPSMMVVSGLLGGSRLNGWIVFILLFQYCFGGRRGSDGDRFFPDCIFVRSAAGFDLEFCPQIPADGQQDCRASTRQFLPPTN